MLSTSGYKSEANDMAIDPSCRTEAKHDRRRSSMATQIKEGFSRARASSIRTVQRATKPLKSMRPLRRTNSTEFYLRARQWRDVAEFERKELLKVRVYRSLRQASAALLAVAIITVIFSILDIELYYAGQGTMEPPQKPPILGVVATCVYKWSTPNVSNIMLIDPNSNGSISLLDPDNLRAETELLKTQQDKLKQFLTGIGFSVRVTISALTVLTLGLIWWYQELERRLLVVRHHLSDSVNLICSPLAPSLYIELCICIIHLPPAIRAPPETQLLTFLRIYQIVKYMREHHPMRYHRMTEILKTVASVKLSSTFLLKSYFLKKPLSMLVTIYLFNVFAVGYIIYSLERANGSCMEYLDVVWMMGVTITNLGYGDFTPSFLLSRLIISILSLLGILQTALIVGVLSETLVIPPDEKRILASVEKQRADQIRRHAAAKLIQATWRQYRYNKIKIGTSDIDIRESKIGTFTSSYKYKKSNNIASRVSGIFQKSKKVVEKNEHRRRSSGRRMSTSQLLRDGRNYNRGYIDALWQWRRVKTSTDTVGQSLEKEFLVDDTAITTTYISRKLDALEKLVRKGTPIKNEESTRLRWLTAGRDALNMTKKLGTTKIGTSDSESKKGTLSHAGSNKIKSEKPIVPDEIKNTQMAPEPDPPTVPTNSVRSAKGQPSSRSISNSNLNSHQKRAISSAMNKLSSLENEMKSLRQTISSILSEPTQSSITYVSESNGDPNNSEHSDDSDKGINQHRRDTNVHNTNRRGAFVTV